MLTSRHRLDTDYNGCTDASEMRTTCTVFQSMFILGQKEVMNEWLNEWLNE